jgi:hypothetical protein
MREALREDFEMPGNVRFITGLPFGNGTIGADALTESDVERQRFATSLQQHTVPLTKLNTADCVDDRQTIAMGDGTSDPEMLENRVVSQLPGGLVLHVTKAAVGANLAAVRDAKNFQAAYESMYEILTGLGYEDGGHQKCGASTKVEASVADVVDSQLLLRTLPVLTNVDDLTAGYIEANHVTKQRRLEDGFYGLWTPGWHEAFLADKVPQNFSILADDPEDQVNHGHHGRGAYAIAADNAGFAKNRFIRVTGQEAFATTIAAADRLTSDIITKIGGSQAERARLRLEFGIDTPQVLNQLVVKDFPVYAQAV